ncbi:hypothetical protein M8C21_007128 [Ambrosia artemisiifolia]|uniref:Uncharacterized protein n=1 Tax=Ambrosia artemisiifolia TaxID=4212 RepID=A0AAD5BR73_AMBAR|nr:hypothetical protein M8C21_007128 [Ambrosia artemisiifolia]
MFTSDFGLRIRMGSRMVRASTTICAFLLVFIIWGDMSFLSRVALATSSPLGVVGGALATHGLATLVKFTEGQPLMLQLVCYEGKKIFGLKEANMSERVEEKCTKFINTFVALKRPMKGHGREMIQFGSLIVDIPFDSEAINGTSKDWKIEPIPSLFQ